MAFIIVTSVGLPEEPLPRRRYGLLGFACLLDLRRHSCRHPPGNVLADLVDERRGKQLAPRKLFSSFMATRFGISESDNLADRDPEITKVPQDAIDEEIDGLV